MRSRSLPPPSACARPCAKSCGAVLTWRAPWRGSVSGTAALKIRHNNVLGYHIEVTPTQAPKIGDGFIHRQTLASSVRYSTVELAELESKIASAADKALALELKLFDELVAEAAAHASA